LATDNGEVYEGDSGQEGKSEYEDGITAAQIDHDDHCGSTFGIGENLTEQVPEEQERRDTDTRAIGIMKQGSSPLVDPFVIFHTETWHSLDLVSSLVDTK
jgi:hypothetical protein